MNEKNHVFAYGTLRRGFSNHSHIVGARFVGGGRTVERYALYKGLYPLVYKNEKRHHIVGEIFEVSDGMLMALDAFEEHPQVYHRELVDVQLDTGRIMKAWLYFNPHRHGMPMDSGDIREGYMDKD